MEKRKMNPVSSFILFVGILVLFLGFIQSADLATETYSSWYETKTEFDFEKFLKYYIPAIIDGTIIFALALVLDLLIAVREKVDELLVGGKGKKKKISNEEIDEENSASKQEILKDLLENGTITQEDYDAEISEKK